jgi:hypothetical protein
MMYTKPFLFISNSNDPVTSLYLLEIPLVTVRRLLFGCAAVRCIAVPNTYKTVQAPSTRHLRFVMGDGNEKDWLYWLFGAAFLGAGVAGDLGVVGVGFSSGQAAMLDIPAHLHLGLPDLGLILLFGSRWISRLCPVEFCSSYLFHVSLHVLSKCGIGHCLQGGITRAVICFCRSKLCFLYPTWT